MSVVFVPKKQRGKAQIDQEIIQRLLDENDQLVRCITEYMQKGRATECVQYQQILHRNIVYLGTIADASPNVPSTLTTPFQNGEVRPIPLPVLNEGVNGCSTSDNKENKMTGSS
ncbi:SS18-like protein 2 [Anguilla rostrata]|uniref:SS18-like protein 2 n=1 Tax=Anguilla anguilla TaxID=7936 RepID=UPI0015A7BCF5|nr:SS18-like protein 2 [Anguilla anguilla]